MGSALCGAGTAATAAATATATHQRCRASAAPVTNAEAGRSTDLSPICAFFAHSPAYDPINSRGHPIATTTLRTGAKWTRIFHLTATFTHPAPRPLRTCADPTVRSSPTPKHRRRPDSAVATTSLTGSVSAADTALGALSATAEPRDLLPPLAATDLASGHGTKHTAGYIVW